jgi:hypothetical protein
MATLTRQELYDLVWSHPRTELASRLGVSDVAIGKACIRENVPAPPRGYWARMEAGQCQAPTPLPLRTPGQDVMVHIGMAADAVVAQAADGPPVAPSFPEDIDSQVSAALAMVPAAAWRSKLTDPHKALRRLLASEDRRRLQASRPGWASLGPYFGSAEHQRQLTLINRLAHAFAPLWHYIDVRVEDEWVQNVGSAHHLLLCLGHDSCSATLAFTGHLQRWHTHANARGHPPDGPLTMYLSVGGDEQNQRQWTDAPERRLETQLPDIAATALGFAEVSLRSWRQARYRDALERIDAAERARIAAELEKQRRAAERAAAAEQARRDELTAEAVCWHQATQIRDYIAHLDAAGPADAEWRAWALRVADEIDPTAGRLQRAETPLPAMQAV